MQTARLGRKFLAGDLDHFKPETFLQEKAEILELASQYEAELEALKVKRKKMPSHIEYKDLPAEKQFKSISKRST